MSVFTNPASRSVEQASAYIAAVLELLGTAEPVTVLTETPQALRQTIGGISSEASRAPEAPGKWAANQMLQHLADSELVWGYRLRMVLAQERPPLVGYDQDLWATRLRYDEAQTEQALEDFTVLRRANLRLLDRMSPADRARVGVHAERGEESVAHMMRLYAGHDLVHLRQLERILHAVGASRPPA